MNVKIIYKGNPYNIFIYHIDKDLGMEWEDADNPKNFTDIEEDELFAIEDLIAGAVEKQNKDLELEKQLSNMELN